MNMLMQRDMAAGAQVSRCLDTLKDARKQLQEAVSHLAEAVVDRETAMALRQNRAGSKPKDR